MMNTETQPAVTGPLDGIVRVHPERAAFEVWAAPILGDNLNWRESGDCELAWQAWQAARPKRPVVGALYNVAAALAQRKPLAALDPMTEVTHIGHRQFGRAYAKADEDTRLLAVKMADALRAL